MSDDKQQAPFASFQPQQPMFTDPPTEQEGAKSKNGRKGPRGKRKAAAGESTPAAEMTPKQRKKRAAGTPRKPRAMKVELSAAMAALTGLREEDAKFVSQVVQAMQPFAKKQRARIVAALGKIFA